VMCSRRLWSSGSCPQARDGVSVHRSPRSWTCTCKVDVSYLTAPNSAPSHSFCNVSTVESGSAVPVRLKHSYPASRSTKENFKPSDEGRDSRMRLPACQSNQHQPCCASTPWTPRRSHLLAVHTGMTSRPMPSPGMRPVRALVLVLVLERGIRDSYTYSETSTGHLDCTRSYRGEARVQVNCSNIWRKTSSTRLNICARVSAIGASLARFSTNSYHSSLLFTSGNHGCELYLI
jgi:hypothetical protein